jgi:hypothetical protein
MLDTAVWRRFDARIHIPLPDEETRGRLIDQFVRPLHIQETERKILLWATEGMSGADLEALIAAGKRFIVLHGGNDGRPTRNTIERGRTLLEALRHQAFLNARLFASDRRDLLVGDRDRFANTLLGAGFTQREAGDLLGLSQSAVSRRHKGRPPSVATEGM